MGGTVIQIKNLEETTEWVGHSSDVANFMNLTEIVTTGIGKGDRYDGVIIFDPEERKIIVDTDYFTMDRHALRFWRLIGFDVSFQSLYRKGKSEFGELEQEEVK